MYILFVSSNRYCPDFEIENSFLKLPESRKCGLEASNRTEDPLFVSSAASLVLNKRSSSSSGQPLISNFFEKPKPTSAINQLP